MPRKSSAQRSRSVKLIESVVALLKNDKVKKYLVRASVVLAGLMLLVYTAARAPEMHSAMIRSSVGDKTYKIRGGVNTGGGTGFAIKAKSGKTVIVSNAHVCEVSPDGVHVLVSNDSGKTMWRKILEVSDRSDLCVIEAMPGTRGLSLGAEPRVGQIVASVGHPSLMPITLSRGEIIGPQDIRIFSAIILDPNDKDDMAIAEFFDPRDVITPDKCRKLKNRVVVQQVDFFFFAAKIKFCVDVTLGAYRTNILIQPGNSGSAMVDFWGNVIGVMFAADRYNWGIAVSHRDLKDLLSGY